MGKDVTICVHYYLNDIFLIIEPCYRNFLPSESIRIELIALPR